MMKWQEWLPVGELLRAVSDSRTLNSDGSRGYKNIGERDRWMAILTTAIIDNEVSAEVKRKAADQASRYAQVLEIKGFTAAYYRARNALVATRKKYIVVLPIWDPMKLVGSRVTIGDVRLQFGAKQSAIYKTIVSEREEQRAGDKAFFVESSIENAEFPLILARLEASSPDEAHSLAREAVNEYLGSICFISNYGRTWGFNSGIQRPLNRVLIAPQETVHTTNGELAYQGYWFETWYPKDFFIGSLDKSRITHLRLQAKTLREAANASHWSDKARLALKMYYSAFSDHTATSAFTSGWQVLELVGGKKDERYERLVDRAAKCFKSYAELKLLGLHLRDRRNSIIHRGEAMGPDSSTLVYQMNELLAPLFLAYIRNPFQFRSESDFWEFYDLAFEKADRDKRRAELQRSLEMLEQAARFRGESPREL